MPDQQHAPGAPDPAVRPTTAAFEPEATIPDVGRDLLAQRATVAAAASAAAGAAAGAGAPGARPRGAAHGLPPGAIGAAALLGLQRSAGNRAAAGLVAGSRLAGHRPARPAAGAARAIPAGTIQATSAAPELGGAALEDLASPPDVASASIDALHATGGTPDSSRSQAPAQAAARELGAAAAPRLAAQRLPAHPAAAQWLAVQRQGGQQITPNFVIPIEPEMTKRDIGSKAAYVRGSVALKGEIKGELVRKGQESAGVGAGGTSNAGGQAEITIAEQKGFAVFDGIEIEKVKETLAFELSKKKLDVSLGGEATFKTRYPWLKVLVGLKFVLAGIEWEQMAKDPGSAVALGVELSGGASGEGRVNVNNDFDVLLTVKATVTGEAHPNWPRIAGEVGKRVAVEGGKAAVQATTTAAGTSAVVIDLGAVAASAAAIAVPLAAAIVMGYGAWQGMKNARAAREAAGWGVYGRKKAEDCARGFARTLTGHAPGNDEGSTEAEAQIQATMTSTGATREMVVAAATQEQGGYAAIYAKNLKRIKEAIYADLVAKWFAANEANFGWLESMGDDWGQKGVFKSTLRIVMFGD